MSEDYLSRAQNRSKLAIGREASAEEWCTTLATMSASDRVEVLTNVDRELESGDGSLRRRAELYAVRRKLGNVHELLRKADR